MINKSSYTAEEKAMAKDLYEKGTSVEEIAAILNKSVQSVRSKLVKEGIYVKVEKHSTRKTGPGKKELVRDLEKLTGIEFTALTGANKLDLIRLKNFIEGIVND